MAQVVDSDPHQIPHSVVDPRRILPESGSDLREKKTPYEDPTVKKKSDPNTT